ELPMILSRRQIGVIESIVVEHIDGDRAAAGPTAVPAPVVVTPQRRADEESDAETDDRGAEYISRRIPVEWLIGRPQPGTVDHVRIVNRHVIDAGIDRLDHYIFGRRRRRQV